MLLSSYKNCQAPCQEELGCRCCCGFSSLVLLQDDLHTYTFPNPGQYLYLYTTVGAKALSPAIVDPLDEPDMVSMRLKHPGGWFPINKICSLLSYLLCAEACKGVSGHSFCKASDSLHCVCKLFLCALKLKLIVCNFRQSAEALETAATSTLGFLCSEERGWFGSYLQNHPICTRENVCVSVGVQNGVCKCTHVLTVLQDNLILSENAAWGI